MNFALVLFALTLFTGAFALADGVYFRKQRAPGEKEPWWIEYPKRDRKSTRLNSSH